jgi:hypothetical protein
VGFKYQPSIGASVFVNRIQERNIQGIEQNVCLVAGYTLNESTFILKKQPDSARLLIFLWLLGLIISGCGIAPATGDLAPSPDSRPSHVMTIEPSAPPTATEVNSEIQPTNLVGDIRTSPEIYDGKSVEIVGYYHGWDVLHETQQAPPVLRSDWVIADSGGAIYVTGRAPAGLDPSSLADVRSLLRLSATVNYIEQSNTVYLKAEHLEILNK